MNENCLGYILNHRKKVLENRIHYEQNDSKFSQNNMVDGSSLPYLKLFLPSTSMNYKYYMQVK